MYTIWNFYNILLILLENKFAMELYSYLSTFLNPLILCCVKLHYDFCLSIKYYLFKIFT